MGHPADSVQQINLLLLGSGALLDGPECGTVFEGFRDPKIPKELEKDSQNRKWS